MTLLESRNKLTSYYEKISSKSENTQKASKNAISNFKKFCNSKFDGRDVEDVVDELLAIKNENAVFDTLQAWINWNSKRINPSTIRTHFSHIRNYLYYRGIKLTSQDVKNSLSFPKMIEEELYPLQSEDVLSIFKVARYDKKALYLAQLSSGMRIGEIVQIRKKHLDMSKNRIMVKIPGKITKLKRARTTFISKEAEQFIKSKLKQIEDNDLVWGVSDDPHNAEINELNILNSYCKKVGLDDKYESTGRYKINSHSFRAFFITKLSRHDENFAKKLAGQKGYLLQYDRMTDDEKLEKYLEIESDLLIFNESKKNAQIEKLQKEKSELKSKTEEISLQKDELDRLKQAVNNIIKEKESSKNSYTDEIKRNKQTISYLLQEVEKLKSH